MQNAKVLSVLFRTLCLASAIVTIFFTAYFVLPRIIIDLPLKMRSYSLVEAVCMIVETILILAGGYFLQRILMKKSQ